MGVCYALLFVFQYSKYFISRFQHKWPDIGFIVVEYTKYNLKYMYTYLVYKFRISRFAYQALS